MASLKIVSDRCDDNSVKFAVVIPPSRVGAVNFGCVEAVNRALLSVNPEAYDPVPIHHAEAAPMLPHVPLPIPPGLLEDDDEPGSLKAGEAFRNPPGEDAE